MTVEHRVTTTDGWMFSAVEVSRIAAWAAQECERQRSGERSVEWMVNGWLHAIQHQHLTPTETDIVHLGRLVEPRHNDGLGYRRVNVQVGGDVCPPWRMVPEAMTKLVAFLTDPEAKVDPEKFYYEYETIHPFRDGNGRTGSILLNWLQGTLGDPVAPPDFWSGR